MTYPLGEPEHRDLLAPVAPLAQAPRPASPESLPSPDTWLAAEVQRLVAAGDLPHARDRFGQLMAIHQRRACRIALAYLRNTADADDAVQDAFVRVFTRIASYDPGRPFGSWFTRILVHVCVDRQRERQRRERSLVALDRAGSTGGGTRAERPDERVLRRQWGSAVAAALNGLPDRQRAVFVLCHYGDRTTAEVSELLGVRESTVRVHLFRAVHKLRAALHGWRHAR
jgi:RNA polymerase sigma-70 factor (ECF subfamily)